MARKDKKNQPTSKYVPSTALDPKIAQLPSGSQTPRTAPQRPSDVGKRFPVWKFRGVDHDGRWGFGDVAPGDLVEILKKLAHFESMTIHEIFHNGDEPGKHYRPDALIPDAQRRLEDLLLDDETRISRLRLKGAQRLYGIVREECFEVLWWDSLHEVCPSPLKHT